MCKWSGNIKPLCWVIHLFLTFLNSFIMAQSNSIALQSDIVLCVSCLSVSATPHSSRRLASCLAYFNTRVSSYKALCYVGCMCVTVAVCWCRVCVARLSKQLNSCEPREVLWERAALPDPLWRYQVCRGYTIGLTQLQHLIISQLRGNSSTNSDVTDDHLKGIRNYLHKCDLFSWNHIFNTKCAVKTVKLDGL